jgi:fibro-slime domain-containing protein
VPDRVVVRSGLFALLALVVASCGARSSLLIPEPCGTPGATRSCANGCGTGEETCEDGAWSSCEVPKVTRTCSDACGTGEETCEDGAWSSCEVPKVTRACSDACGTGEETCEGGDWQACRVPEAKRPCMSVCGSGNETCRGGEWGRCDAPLPKPPKIKATVRDFSPATHPDFEAPFKPSVDRAIVLQTLGADDKPVYGGMPRTPTTSGAPQFAQWFHDDPVNRSAPLELQLLPSKDDAGSFVYDNRAFFPIDGQLLGNEGRAHNYHFTLEASTSFQYVGGEVFSFSGDDDMWVFINRQKVIDLGGLHSIMSAEVAIDPLATSLGLSKGGTYPLHFFFAERHTSASNFTIRTSIAEPGSCE